MIPKVRTSSYFIEKIIAVSIFILSCASIFIIQTPVADAALNVSVVGITSTQAILSYTAPTSAACQVQVSESSGLSPLVHDVDPTLFSGADMDSRASSLGNTTSQLRIFVVGKRAAEKATDGNNYSRALQAYTTHYYKVTCGSSVATGTFQTSNIPVGNTYHDTLPPDPSHTGTYAYPTISASDRTQTIIDPQSGLQIKRVSVVNDNSTVTFGAAGFQDFCSSVLSADSQGTMGYHCLVAKHLLWINPVNGEVRALGLLDIPYDPPSGFGGGCYNGMSIDTDQPSTFYCGTGGADHTTGSNDGTSIIIKLVYQGSNASGTFEGTIPACKTSAPPCMALTLLTPNDQGKDVSNLVKNFEPSFNGFVSNNGWYIGAIQNGLITINATNNGQDTLGWIAMFNPNTKTVVAAMNTWKTAPTRWAVLHSIDNTGDTNWLALSLNTLERYGTNVDFASEASSSISSSLDQCPTNAFGATGVNCSTIQVNGEPCSVNPPVTGAGTNPTQCTDPARPYYLQDAQEGDYVYIGNNSSSEPGRLVVKNGKTWTIQRNFFSWLPPQNWPAGTLIAMDTGAGTYAGNWNYFYWNFVADPHGLNVGGTSIIQDAHNNATHTVYRPNVKIESGQVRQGIIPDFISSTILPIQEDGSFAGTTANPWDVDQHPSLPINSAWYLDGRPWQGNRNDSGATGSLVTGTLYKFTSNAYGGSGSQLNLNRNLVPTLATAGKNVLVDVSGPNSVISGNSSDNYTYCVSKRSGECVSGSSVGDVYVNAPNVSIAQCLDAHDEGGNGWAFQDICIGDNGSRTNSIMQQGINLSDGSGLNNRFLTSGFVQYRRQDQYWNVRPTPDGNWMFFAVPTNSDYGNTSGQLFVAKLPPFPTADGTDRSTFVPITLSITPPTVSGQTITQAVVEFGYAENGPATSYFCTSRQEACVKGNQGGTTYGYLSDNVPGVSCTTSCSIIIPSIPQRITYYQIQYKNSAGTVVATEQGASAEKSNVSVGSSGGQSGSSGGTSGGTPPVLPPVISAVALASISSSGVTISWTTNTLSTTQIRYGATLNYGASSAVLDTIGALTHSVVLSSSNASLSPNTVYHFMVQSQDLLGNLATSSDYTFTTGAAATQSTGGGGGGGGSTSTGGGSTGSSGSSGGGGGGGGIVSTGGGGGAVSTGSNGGIVSSPIPVPAILSNPTVPTSSVNTPISTNTIGTNTQTTTQTNSNITHSLYFGIGAYSGEVSTLQKFLTVSGYMSTIAKPGIFDLTTRDAVRKYQCAQGIVCGGNEITTGYGTTGPKTRTAMISQMSIPSNVGSTSISLPNISVPSTSSVQPTPTVTSASPILTHALYFGVVGYSSEVQALQTFLKTKGYLSTISKPGVFDASTRTALDKYQCAQGIVCGGNEITTGYGSTGSRTRAAINKK